MRVNAVAPGMSPHPVAWDNCPWRWLLIMAQTLPLGRFGTEAEVAADTVAASL